MRRIALCLVFVFLQCFLSVKTDGSYLPELPSKWMVLAPFPIGTREKGVDVLEAFGGINNANSDSSYPSDVINGAKVSWTQVDSTVSNGVYSVSISFPNSTDWSLIESWAGSVGASFLGWAVGSFNVAQSGRYGLYCSSLSIFYIDGKMYNGDNYGQNRLNSVVQLQAGSHTMQVQFSGSEGKSFSCNFFSVESSPVKIISTDIILPDIVDGQLASPYLSISVLNTLTDNPIRLIVDFEQNSGITITEQDYPLVWPGQTLPLKFQAKLDAGFTCNTQANFTIYVEAEGYDMTAYPLVFNCKTFGDSYTFTFPDVDDSVQLAEATPPVNTCPESGCPILLTLHGAGVGKWAGAYQRQNFSWTLLPTNRREYGWDWQGPGLWDALRALEYFSTNLPGVEDSLKSSYGADSTKLLYAGHSMGGHGCWTMSTHFPDRALSVSPASGWIDFEMYSPFWSRVGLSLTTPQMRYVLDIATSEYRNDYYSQHLDGIPVLIRMGSDDDNVPPYLMRRMARLIDELTGDPDYVTVSEVPNEGHWWDGVVDDSVMQGWFDSHVTTPRPSLPDEFVVVTTNPASSEGRGGIRILQMTSDYRESQIYVNKESTHWRLVTQNVRRFGFYSFEELDFPQNGITVDGMAFSGKPGLLPDSHFCKIDNTWKVCTGKSWENTERSPSNYGPLEQILNNKLMFVVGTQGSQQDTIQFKNAALKLANDLMYQIRAYVTIVEDIKVDMDDITHTNLILFGGPTTNALAATLSSQWKVPVTFQSDRTFTLQNRRFNEPATGILFLAPSGQNRLMAVMEGTDPKGFDKAVSLFPTKSGLSLPDYVVAGPRWGWAGDGGLLAGGFWDYAWAYNSRVGFVVPAAPQSPKTRPVLIN